MLRCYLGVMELGEDEISRFRKLAEKAALERGLEFAPPIKVEYLNHPVAHWQVTSRGPVVVLLNGRGEVLNVEVGVEPPAGRRQEGFMDIVRRLFRRS